MSRPSASTPLLPKRRPQSAFSILKSVKMHVLALLAALSIAALLNYLFESTQLFFHRKSYTSTSARPSSAAPPPSHEAERITIAKLPAHYLPTPNHHGHPPRRVIIVGDIHGCLSTLHALLSKLSFTPAADHLIFAGDFINKGPDSHGVVAYARKVGASCVRGNHEDKFLKALQSLSSSDENKGEVVKGVRGIDGKMKKLAEQLTRGDVEFIQACPHILSLGIGRVPGLLRGRFLDVVVVHGGLEPGVPLHSQDAFSVMNMRAIVPRSGRPEARRNKGVAWWRVWNKAQKRLGKRAGTLVVYGHDSRQGLVQKEFSVGLDSGCVNGGRLSALVIDEEGMEVVSVKSHVKD